VPIKDIKVNRAPKTITHLARMPKKLRAKSSKQKTKKTSRRIKL